MRLLLTMILFILVHPNSMGQDRRRSPSALLDSIKFAKTDSAKYQFYSGLSYYYIMSNRDSALYYIEERLALARKNNKKLPEIYTLNQKALQLAQIGRYAEAYVCLIDALRIADDPASQYSYWARDTTLTSQQTFLASKGHTYFSLAHLFGVMYNRSQQIFHLKVTEEYWKQSKTEQEFGLLNFNLGEIYLEQNKLDSAEYYFRNAERVVLNHSFPDKALGVIQNGLGRLYLARQDLNVAKSYFYSSIATSKKDNSSVGLAANYISLSDLYRKNSQKDSCLYYAKLALEEIRRFRSSTVMRLNMGTAFQRLGLAYGLSGITDSAFLYQSMAVHFNDSAINVERKSLAQFQEMEMNERNRIQELEKEKIQFRSRVRTNILFGGVGIMFIVAGLVLRNLILQRRAKKKIEVAYRELKSTQSQLIQSEKMASLGELTAGIAHEIQNPLNFVNNFSEISRELIEELKNQKSELKSEEQDEILNDIYSNLEKINQHGKRADAIVKGMLQHSRSSSGKKEPTDINALCDEYLRLAYHGLRAKDDTFHATSKTEFDPAIGSINIVPQEVGRVLLNLINNAFYAVKQKAKTETEAYQPTVTVATRKLGQQVEISVKDNGQGIPDSIRGKIFQPFFTTKPTGQGTGLGLSLAYDIVTKGHGGEFRVESIEGQETEFIVTLPT